MLQQTAPASATSCAPSSAPAARDWNTQARNREARLERAAPLARGKVVNSADAAALLEAILETGDRVCLEGNNQKQADFLAKVLAGLDPARVNGLHMVQSVLALPEHLDVFESGVASRLDFSFSGPQGARLARLVSGGQIAIGAIHTYLELFSRYFVDLTPRVSLVCAQAADRNGNLYTGPNTEDTPVIVEATAFKRGIVIAQVNELVDTLPRVDIPADWVDFVIPSPKPHYIEPLFTRDPAQISDIQVLMAMMAIKGIYAPYEVNRLNHGIGFDTAAIELILPTYAESLGLKGKICRHWALNPHPALIPAIEAGFVQSVHSFGSELGMEAYIRARPDVFFTGPDGSMRSNRAMCQAAGHYACDLFIGSTLQIDLAGNSSTATLGRIAGFGGAPNMGADARGRRHASPTWLKAGREARAGRNLVPRGQKLVVQMVETYREHMQPAFVETLDAFALAESAGMDLPPVMIYGEDVTHILTEEGIANLLLCRTDEEREQAIRGVAGYTPVGLGRDKRAVENLHDRGIILRPEDLCIDKRSATRDLLAARSIKDLVRASGGLYDPPKRFRNW
ncbi:malonate decarboxylase subunit alpha [Xanthobacter oligotrophicus]|uniref:malonate decarboxylase subunit alpha n=1 Tax=Xanthobacter oligotrophicus TaxID=2607286 RepID=UPI0011F1F6CA|nr:malonate decarboxylase subunit alpha [Xanthobacter oligotrophicus]MCG5236558.1 malonate decarboxylase subunit alpha [Xanthobacter oligotrophicus]